MEVQSREQVRSHLNSGIAGSNATDGRECSSVAFVVFMYVLYLPLRRAGHSFRGVVPSVVCLILCGLETTTKSLPRLKLGRPATEKKELMLYSKFHLECLVVNKMMYNIVDLKERSMARTSE